MSSPRRGRPSKGSDAKTITIQVRVDIKTYNYVKANGGSAFVRSIIEESMKKTFAYHKPSDASLEKITGLREAYSVLHSLIEEMAPASRERSVAITELETSAMWAIKSIVSNDPESTPSL